MNTTRITLFAAGAALVALLITEGAHAEEMTNQPPRFTDSYDEDRRIKLGGLAEVNFEAIDPENDPIVFHVTGLPWYTTPSARTSGMNSTN